ncbi:MAG TPA: DUF2269 family protein [Geobacteraceae bacterium]
MMSERITTPLLRTLHLLSVCAWIGGGIGILLLLSLDYHAETASELQAFNRVIDAVDDWIIAPGAVTTLVSGLLLAHVRKLPVLSTGFFRIKLYCTVTAIAYGLFFVAPRLEKLLIYSRMDDLAVFDDRLYAGSYLVGAAGCAVQSVLVLGLLVISVLRPRLFARRHGR